MLENSKNFHRPPKSSENFSQTPAKDPIIFTDPPSVYALDNIGAILLFLVNPPIGVQKLLYTPSIPQIIFRDPPNFDPSPPIINFKSLIEQ